MRTYKFISFKVLSWYNTIFSSPIYKEMYGSELQSMESYRVNSQELTNNSPFKVQCFSLKLGSKNESSFIWESQHQNQSTNNQSEDR